MKKRVPASVLKNLGWAAVKPCMQVLMIVGLLLALPGLLSSVTQIFLQDEMEDAIAEPAAEFVEYYLQVDEFMAELERFESEMSGAGMGMSGLMGAYGLTVPAPATTAPAAQEPAEDALPTVAPVTDAEIADDALPAAPAVDEAANAAEDAKAEAAAAIEQKAEELAQQDPSQKLLDAYWGFLTGEGKGILIMAALELVLTPVLMGVMYGALLDAYRKKQLTLPGALGYLRYGPKLLLLSIWQLLRMYVWMLPGMAVMFAGTFVMLFFGGFVSMLGEVLLFSGFAFSMVLGVRAGLHYILAPIALMDDPTRSVNGCIRASWSVMRNRKGEYFVLMLSFFGWRMLVMLIGQFAIGTLMTIVALTASMVASLVLNLYINGTLVAFWDAYTGDGREREAMPDAVGEEKDMLI